MVCDPRFAAVKEALAGNFAERGELGAAVTIALEGRVVVESLGGVDGRGADAWGAAGRRPRRRAIAATAVLARDRGPSTSTPGRAVLARVRANGKDLASSTGACCRAPARPVGLHRAASDFIVYEQHCLTEAPRGGSAGGRPARTSPTT
jgi:hypothetical protein